MKHLFVVSYGRSGSTLLTTVLNAIPGYCIRGENGGILGPMVESDRMLRSAHAQKDLHSNDPASPWFGFSEIEPDTWRRECARVFTEQVLLPPQGTRVTGFKEVRYTPEDMDAELFHAAIDFLVEGFPEARVVFNTRHANEVARSGWWATGYAPEQVREIVAVCDHRFREAHARLGPGRSFLIDYAEYNGKPAGYLALLDWLGEKLPMATLLAISARRLPHYQNADSPPWGKVRRWIAGTLQG